MQLSYVFYQLKNRNVPMWSRFCGAAQNVEMFMIYDPCVPVREGVLYVLDESMELRPQKNTSRIPMLILSEREVPNPPACAIAIKKMPISSLVNILSQIFSEYQTLCLSVQAREPDLFALMNQVADTLGVSATIIGSSMTGIAFSDDLKQYPAFFDAAEASSVQTQTIWDRRIYETQELRDVFLYENHFFDQKALMMLCFNLFVKQRFYARFALMFPDEWKIDYLKPVTAMLGRELELYFNTTQLHNQQVQKTESFRNAMQAIVNGSRLEDILDLNRFGWYEDQEYQVYVFRFDARFPMKVAKEYLQQKLAEYLGECFITERSAEVICVCNRSISQLTYSESQKQLAAFLSEYIGRVGISNSFRSLFEIPKYIRQAQWAMKLGEQKNPMHWYHHFRDYTYEYVLEQSVREFPVEEIVMPELYLLLERDREKGSELFDTLETYVRTKCNGQATAKLLFIHRTTFLYRMKQIEELLNLDVQKEDIYKRLLLSFELYHRRIKE